MTNISMMVERLYEAAKSVGNVSAVKLNGSLNSSSVFAAVAAVLADQQLAGRQTPQQGKPKAQPQQQARGQAKGNGAAQPQ